MSTFTQYSLLIAKAKRAKVIIRNNRLNAIIFRLHFQNICLRGLVIVMIKIPLIACTKKYKKTVKIWLVIPFEFWLISIFLNFFHIKSDLIVKQWNHERSILKLFFWYHMKFYSCVRYHIIAVIISCARRFL